MLDTFGSASLGRFLVDNMNCLEKKFELQTRKWEEYKGTRDPSTGTDDASAPLAMVVNSSELHPTDFHLAEVMSLPLDTVTRGIRRTRGAAVRNLQGVDNITFV